MRTTSPSPSQSRRRELLGRRIKLRIVVAATLLSVITAGGGCKRSTSAKASASPAIGEIDRLRSLPYAGFTPDESVRESGVQTYDPERAFAGFTLCTLHSLARAELLTMGGEVYHAWEMPESRHWAKCEMLPNGDVVVIGADASDDRGPYIPDDARYIARLTWEGDVLWRRQLPVHHDVEVGQDGSLLTLALHLEAIPAINPRIPTRDDRLVLLNGDGRELESRSLYQAAVNAPELWKLQPVAPMRWGAGAIVDLFHANTVERMKHLELAENNALYSLDNVLFCTRNQDLVGVINWPTGRLVWAWGQGEISGPHAPTVLEDGHILLLDNGLGIGRSRVLEVEPASGDIVWEYEADPASNFYTASRGAAQRLANGNTLVTNSDNGEVFEVTSAGETVWRYLTPHTNENGGRATIVRAFRISEDRIKDVERQATKSNEDRDK